MRRWQSGQQQRSLHPLWEGFDFSNTALVGIGTQNPRPVGVGVETDQRLLRDAHFSHSLPLDFDFTTSSNALDLKG